MPVTWNTLQAKKLLSSESPETGVPGAGLEPASPFGRQLLRPLALPRLPTRARNNRSRAERLSLSPADQPNIELRGALRAHQPDPEHQVHLEAARRGDVTQIDDVP